MTSGMTYKGVGSKVSPSGRRLEGKPIKKGLYILNGRKVVVK